MYKRITSLCVVVAAGSVILFDKFPRFHRLAGLFLIASGIAAAAVHLHAQWHPLRMEEEQPSSDPEFGYPPSHIGTTEEPMYVTAIQPETITEAGPAWETLPFNVPWLKDPSKVEQVPTLVSARLVPILYVSRPSVDLDTVTRLCERLAASETDFEVTLAGDGSLTIRPIRQEETFETSASKARFMRRERVTPETVQ